jgi:hypothetical protein
MADFPKPLSIIHDGLFRAWGDMSPFDAIPGDIEKGLVAIVSTSISDVPVVKVEPVSVCIVYTTVPRRGFPQRDVVIILHKTCYIYTVIRLFSVKSYIRRCIRGSILPYK